MATLRPVPAMTNAPAVEMLKVWAPSPPVPTMSKIGSSPFSRGTLLATPRMARALPVISSTHSPFMRSAMR
ncbi:MAG: hypothetical protein P8Z41_09725 [Anaerolineales bacterium]